MKIVKRAALAAAIGAVSLAASVAVAAASKPAADACYAKTPGLNAAKTAVSDSGYCVINGHHVGASLRYGVSQEDANRYPCGKTLTGLKATAPLWPGIYKVTATFQAISRAKVGGKYISSKPATKSFVLGGDTWSCGELPATAPSFSQLCDFQLDASMRTPAGNICGELLRDSSSDTNAYPMWLTKPRVSGLLVRDPVPASLSGECRTVVQVPLSRKLTWMGQPLFSAYYDCKGGFTLIPQLTLVYDPQSAGGPGCTFTRTELSLSTLTQFTLSSNSPNWGGQLKIVWALLIYKNMAPEAIMYADKQVDFPGSSNACADLSTHGIG